ncbi:hypothetical protein [Oxalicibacterium solurbis]|uniref:Uncharacterized protein n=1 Tax=Oxalicibacterium solurbis TaxID=69280 RepID=A0A8J3B0X1_9BURK|nr:hypothetical protein [Oxalicibacterium solurbis]GGI52859.1 hypothetical protein GCM10011430_00330 [Oxalicibacterium solurbis]
MTNAGTIARRQPDSDGLDFDALRATGIALLQQLCGETWTDYNLHDPGVTILEQLCYGLTDLAYRSGFEPQDYLTGPDGRIDYAAQGLYMPEDILPVQPITENDYRKIIYDAVPQIDDLWLERLPADGKRPRGLYTLRVLLDETFTQPASDAQREAVRQRIRATYSAHRNLGEDLEDVVIVDTAPYFLTGEIELEGFCNPAEVYARIFFACERCISSGFYVHRYEDVFAAGVDLDKLFLGPLTRHGHIDDERISSAQRTVTLVDLIGLIQQIDGVRQVHELGLVDAQGQPAESLSFDPSASVCPRLQFPANADQDLLHLVFGRNAGAALAPEDDEARRLRKERRTDLLSEARDELVQLQFGFRAFRNSRQTFSQFIPVPEGQRRDLADYYSVQHHFPAIYGINRHGVPDSAPARRKAEAAQLKAYLYLPEQLMADYLQNLQEMRRMFSIEDGMRQSYFTQYIGNDSLSGIEALYAQDRAHTTEALAAVRRQHDNAADRRSRALDYMLAIYGEQFTQKSLNRFSYESEAQRPWWLAEKKLAFLKNIVDISARRATGFDYLRPAWESDNIAGLQRKVGVLLGIEEVGRFRRLGQVLQQRNLRLLPDKVFDRSTKQLNESRDARPVPRIDPSFAENEETSSLFNGIVLGESVFRHGIDTGNYVLIPEEGQRIAVCFKPHRDARPWLLATAPDYEKAKRCAWQMSRELTALNAASEGLHIVEHVLLRPRGAPADASLSEADSDFFTHRISVVFPGWTARFHDSEFRKLAEETVCMNAPAHLLPEFYWLDHVQLCDFESRLHGWLHALRSPQQDDATIDTASAALRAFLRRHVRTERDYWV